MPLNLTHWTFKHSQISVMTLCIAKKWSSPLPVFILFLYFGERCCQPTRLLRENEPDGVFCPNKVALLTCLMCTRPRVRGTSRCCLLFTSAHYSIGATQSQTPAQRQPRPAWSKQRDKEEDSVKERKGTPHLSCRHSSYSEGLSVSPLQRPSLLLCGGESDWSAGGCLKM